MTTTRKLLLLALIVGLAGCSSASPFLTVQNPGMAQVGDATVQLIFANPNYDDHLLTDDPLEGYGKKAGMPSITGGVGLTATWHF
jgi:hypothetical protein